MEIESPDVFQPVNPVHILLERIGGAIFSAFFGGAILVGILICAFIIGMNSAVFLVLYGAALILAGFIAVMNFVWPALSYRHTAWRLNEDGLEIRRGVLWRHQISVPRARVQHADVTQGPLQRHYGIAQLIVYTAGTQNASVSLDGLTHQVAIELRDQLVRQGKEIHVV